MAHGIENMSMPCIHTSTCCVQRLLLRLPSVNAHVTSTGQALHLHKGLSITTNRDQSWALTVLPLLAQGTPDMPQCGFSRMACVVLHAYGESGGTR